MADKVTVEVELDVMVPVKVKAQVSLRCSDNPKIEYTLKRYFSKGINTTATCDVENVSVEDVAFPSDGPFEFSDAEDYILDAADNGKLRGVIKQSKVTYAS